MTANPLYQGIGTFGGVRITFVDAALATTEERLFPASRHRSARIRKKLIKRFGGEFKRVPAIFQTPNGIFAHPSFRARIEQEIRRQA